MVSTAERVLRKCTKNSTSQARFLSIVFSKLLLETFIIYLILQGASGLGPSIPSKLPFALAASIRLVVNTIEAVPTITPATPQPMATANPDDDFDACC